MELQQWNPPLKLWKILQGLDVKVEVLYNEFKTEVQLY